jgi:2-phospho-L-lactate transferase/gluconeogenesis factor (CofD/UPF0052 family)
MRRAVEASSALKIYVCNVATQPGETDGFDVGQHVSSLQRHVGRGLFPYVLANNRLVAPLEQPHLQPVGLTYPADGGYQVIEADLVDQETPWRHDAGKLGDQIIDFYTSL